MDNKIPECLDTNNISFFLKESIEEILESTNTIIELYRVKPIQNIELICLPNSRAKYQNNIFKISLPYMDEILEWKVDYSRGLYLPPSFSGTNLENNKFFMTLKLEELQKIVPSLRHWTEFEPGSLKNVLVEFYNLHRINQFKLLQNSSYFLNIYMNLLKNNNFLDVNVLCTTDYHKFCLYFNFDDKTKDLPPYSQNINAINLEAHLVVKCKNNKDDCTYKFFMSKRLEAAISWLDKNFKLPPSDGKNIILYIEEFKALFLKTLDKAMNSLKKRRGFINQLKDTYCSHILSIDEKNYESISLTNYPGNEIYVTVELSNNFPQSKPNITIGKNVNIEKQLNNVQWKPNLKWSDKINIIYKEINTALNLPDNVLASPNNDKQQESNNEN